MQQGGSLNIHQPLRHSILTHSLAHFSNNFDKLTIAISRTAHYGRVEGSTCVYLQKTQWQCICTYCCRLTQLMLLNHTNVSYVCRNVPCPWATLVRRRVTPFYRRVWLSLIHWLVHAECNYVLRNVIIAQHYASLVAASTRDGSRHLPDLS